MQEANWTPEMLIRLRELWASGLSEAKIGKELGVTKAAVNGKVHRLGLPPRGSPIKPGKPKAKRLRKGESTLPPLPSQEH